MVTILLEAFWLAAGFTILCASVWGGRDERLFTLIIVAGLIATQFAVRAHGVRYSSVELGVATVDLAMAAAMILLSLKTDRYWPLWATSTHLASIYTHLAMYFAQTTWAFLYHSMITAWAYLGWIPLLIGVANYQRRRRSGR